VRYSAVVDSSGKCLCSAIPIVARILAGAAATYYARLGAPPAATKQVDFELPGFPPVRSVALT